MKKELTQREMAKKGGESTMSKYGIEHYKKISRRGVEARRNNNEKKKI